MDLETVVRPHFILSIKYQNLSDLNGYKVKVVSVIEDEELDLLDKLQIIDIEGAPRREEGETAEEYFDSILDKRIIDLILEPASVCLELEEG